MERKETNGGYPDISLDNILLSGRNNRDNGRSQQALSRAESDSIHHRRFRSSRSRSYERPPVMSPGWNNREDESSQAHYRPDYRPGSDWNRRRFRSSRSRSNERPEAYRYDEREVGRESSMMYHHRRSRSRSRSRERGQMMERSRAHPSYYNRSRSRERQRARDDFHLRLASRPGHSGDNHGRNSQRGRSHSSERSRASDMNSFPRTQGGRRPTGSERVSPSRSSTNQSYKRPMGCCVRCDGCLMLDAPPIDYFF